MTHVEKQVYYNDNNEYCCKVLQKNIDRGYLPEGTVDGRDIRDVSATDLMGYQHIHLFAGIGGFPLGFTRAGFPSDISLLTGGFPCQDISISGRGAGIEGARSGLWGEMHRLICAIRPQYVIVENVPTLLARGMGRVLGDLAAIGYDAQWQVLSAAQFGAPHLRKRLFIIAYPMQERPHSFFTRQISPRTRYPLWTQPKRQARILGVSRDRLSQLEESLGEPSVFGSDDGLSDWMDRLEGLGNSVVPQCAEYIGRCIVESECVA